LRVRFVLASAFSFIKPKAVGRRLTLQEIAGRPFLLIPRHTQRREWIIIVVIAITSSIDTTRFDLIFLSGPRKEGERPLEFLQF
jgi:hypothetical protein